MMEPWMDPTRFGIWYGGMGGGVMGSCAVMLAIVAAVLASRGKGRNFILGAFTLMKWFGWVNLGLGLYAISRHQPFGIWYPLTVIGLLFSLLFTLLRPVVRKRYEEVERRQMAGGWGHA
ncbi:MAG: hypothetical protein WBQ09_12250 [Terriglobales bacterium]|jgi:hypothetical protein